MRPHERIVAATIVMLCGGILAAAVVTALSDLAWMRVPFRLMCHSLPQRSFHFDGHIMPLCARCCGIYAGAIAAVLAATLMQQRLRVGARMLLIVALPFLIDGGTQALGMRSSTNALRFGTGALAGSAFVLYAMSSLFAARQTPFASEVAASHNLDDARSIGYASGGSDQVSEPPARARLRADR